MIDMQTITSAVTAVSSVKGIFDMLSSVREFFLESKEKKQNQEMLFRNYYSEVYLNREFIHTLKLDDNPEIKKNPIEYIKTVAPMLENSYGKILVTGLSLYKEKLDSMQLPKYVDDEDMEDKSDRDLVRSIIFTVNRIDLLKKIASAPESANYMFKEIRPAVRIKNIIDDSNFILQNFKYSFEEMISK